MSKYCCGIEHNDNEIYCRNCGKVLPDVEDSAFVPEEDISSSPTVVIDVDKVKRLAGNGYEQGGNAQKGYSQNGYQQTGYTQNEYSHNGYSDTAAEYDYSGSAAEYNGYAGTEQDGNMQNDTAFGQYTSATGTLRQTNAAGSTGQLNAAGATGRLNTPGATGRLNTEGTAHATNTETSGKKHIGLLITSIVILSIAVLGFISMIFLTYQYTISSDGNKYKGAAGKGFVDEVAEPVVTTAEDMGGDE